MRTFVKMLAAAAVLAFGLVIVRWYKEPSGYFLELYRDYPLAFKLGEARLAITSGMSRREIISLLGPPDEFRGPDVDAYMRKWDLLEVHYDRDMKVVRCRSEWNL